MEQVSAICIYGIRDPRDGQIHYIGRTCDLRRRVLDHLSGNAGQNNQNYVTWIRSMMFMNTMFTSSDFVILEWFPPIPEVKNKLMIQRYYKMGQAEMKWMNFGFKNQWPLVNVINPDYCLNLGKRPHSRHRRKRYLTK